jgi:Carboxypeptidase regulatory-like domain
MIAGLLWMMMFGWALQQQTSHMPSGTAQGNAGAVERYRVAGVVVDAVSGQPLPNAKMSIDTVENFSRDNEDDSESTTLSDVGGRFVFENLAEGHYVLWGTRKGYVEQRYKQHGTFSTGIVLERWVSAENLRFEMTPDASIIGQITDEMSEPVRLAHVRLIREGRVNGRRKNVPVREADTDDLGRYRADHLQPGTYVVVVTARPWYAGGKGRARPGESFGPNANSTKVKESYPGDVNTDVTYPVTYFPSAVDFAAATPIVLHPGDAETANVSLTAVPAVRLTFRKYGSEPDEQLSVASITHTIADGITERVSYGASESEGMVEVVGLPPGNLNVQWMTTKGSDVKTRTQTIHLGGAGRPEISDESAMAPATVGGTIQLDPRLRLQNPVILLGNSTTFAQARATAESNGEFKFSQEFVPGTYEISVPRAPGASLVIAASGAKTAGTTIEISAGQDVQLKIFVSVSSGQVTGVAMKDGKGVDGVMVLLVPADFEHESGRMRIDQSDSDGSFHLARIVPGKYTILGIEDAWKAEWSSPEFLRKFLAGGQVVEIGADAKLKVNVNVQKNTSATD